MRDGLFQEGKTPLIKILAHCVEYRMNSEVVVDFPSDCVGLFLVQFVNKCLFAVSLDRHAFNLITCLLVGSCLLGLQDFCQNQY